MFTVLKFGRKWKPLWIIWFPISLFWGCSNPEPVQESLIWEPLPALVNASLRGLCVVNDSVVWASGTAGTWIRSVDQGKTFIAGQIPGADSLDLRDIHARSESEAWVLTAGSPAVIWYTHNGGKNWTEQYRNEDPDIFMDGFDFNDHKSGIAYGDPIDGQWQLVRTRDNGKHWGIPETEFMDSVSQEEAGFAASGTGIQVMGEAVWMASGGGTAARIWKSTDFGTTWSDYATPMRSESGCGIFSFVFWNEQEGVAVGGCYVDSTATDGNCAITRDGGLTWEAVRESPPRGYRSCVAHVPGRDLLFTVGRTGTDASTDGGKSWFAIGDQRFNACAFSSAWGFAVGKDGSMARMQLDPSKAR